MEAEGQDEWVWCFGMGYAETGAWAWYRCRIAKATLLLRVGAWRWR